MARGVMVCATTHAGAKPPGVPLRLRKSVPPPPEFRKPAALRQDARFNGGRLLVVPPYSHTEVQAALEFYAVAGHVSNPALGEQLRTGELANKVKLTTAGVAEDVFKLCQQL